MKRLRFKVRGSNSVVSRQLSAVLIFLLLLFTAHGLPLTVSAHGGEDHGESKPATDAANKSAVATVRAERNLQTEVGRFNVRLERSPADPRTGELVQMALRPAEKVEGGFGGGEPIAIEDAAVLLNVTTADGAILAENLPVTFEKGFYRADYAFSRAGNDEVVFNVTTADRRSFSVDFPVSIVAAPINWTFWLGIIVLSLLGCGAIGAVFYT